MRISPAAHVVLSSLFALVLFGGVACSSDKTTGVDTTGLVGVYTLTTVDGSALPAPAKDPVTGVVAGTYTSGSVTLTAAKTFTVLLNYTLANGTTGSLPGAGTYTVSGSTVTFIEANVTATFSGGNTLTATLSNQLFVFKK